MERKKTCGSMSQIELTASSIFKVMSEPAAVLTSQRRILPLLPSGIELCNCTMVMGYVKSHMVLRVLTLENQVTCV